MRPSPLLALVPWLTAVACSPAPPPASAPRPEASALVAAVASSAPSASVAASAREAPVAPAAPVATEDAGPPLPAGFVAVADEGQTACGEFMVERPVETDGEKGSRFVRVLRRDGTRAYEAHGQRYRLEPTEPAPGKWRQWMSVEFCGDLTGDGVPELVLTESTMGAHCCYTHHVVSLTTPTRRLMTWEKGDMGTPLVPVRYRPTGPWQIEGLVVTWPPFDGEKGDPVISYAGAPVIPVVLALHDGEYKLTSFSFPEAFRKQRDRIHAGCSKSDDCDGMLIAWVDSIVIGDWETEKKRPMYRDYLPSFDRLAPTMRREMLKGFGSERAPRRLSALR